MFLDRFLPPEGDDPVYMRKQEEYYEAEMDYKDLKYKLDDPDLGEDERLVLEEKLLDMYQTVYDLMLEMEELS